MVRRRVIADEMPGVSINLPRPPTAGEARCLYALELKVQWVIPLVGPFDDFLDMYDGEIVLRHLDQPPETAGRFLAIRIRAEDAHEGGTTVREVIGTCGSYLVPYYRALFSERTDDIRRSVRQQFGVEGSNILLLYTVLVLPAHRGRRLGLATASRLVETLGGGCALVACRPLAAQFCKPISDREFHEAMRLDEFPDHYPTAIRRLHHHARRLGLRRVGRSDVFAASIEHGWLDPDDF